MKRIPLQDRIAGLHGNTAINDVDYAIECLRTVYEAPMRTLIPRQHYRDQLAGKLGLKPEEIEDLRIVKVANLIEELLCLIKSVCQPVPDSRKPQLGAALSHHILVCEEPCSLISDARKAHVLGNISDRPDSDVCLVGQHSGYLLSTCDIEDALLIAHIEVVHLVCYLKTRVLTVR